MASIRHRLGRALADRRGLSALEYALMAAFGAMVLVVGYNAFFTRMGATLALTAFPG